MSSISLAAQDGNERILLELVSLQQRPNEFLKDDAPNAGCFRSRPKLTDCLCRVGDQDVASGAADFGLVWRGATFLSLDFADSKPSGNCLQTGLQEYVPPLQLIAFGGCQPYNISQVRLRDLTINRQVAVFL